MREIVIIHVCVTDVYIGHLRKYATNLRTFTEIRNKFTDIYGNTQQIYGNTEQIYRNTEQIAPHIGLIRDATFSCQIKDDSVFYRTGGNPTAATTVPSRSLSICTNNHISRCSGDKHTMTHPAVTPADGKALTWPQVCLLWVRLWLLTVSSTCVRAPGTLASLKAHIILVRETELLAFVVALLAG